MNAPRPRPVAPNTGSADQKAARQKGGFPRNGGGKAANKSLALANGSRAAMRDMARRKAAYGG